MLCLLVVAILLLSVGGVETQPQQQQTGIVHTTATLSEARAQLVATSSGELVFFAGGANAIGQASA
jgi:hypothetical protein